MEATSIYWSIFVFVALFVVFAIALSIRGARKQEGL